MIVESILSTISKLLDWVIDKIPGVDLSSLDFAKWFDFLVEKGKQINFLLPVKEALIFLGIIISIKLALLIFWAAQRVINLLRGAG